MNNHQSKAAFFVLAVAIAAVFLEVFLFITFIVIWGLRKNRLG
jgi:hypothetical protein